MPKYSVEDNLDFYAELYKSLDESGENKIVNNNENDNICLITNSLLTENYVKLACGHRFNYIPLFKDLVVRKNKTAAMDTQILKTNEIRCPYCRNKEMTLLPYYENMGVDKVHGVNFIDETKIVAKTKCASSYFSGSCNYKDGNLFCQHTYVTTFEDGKDYCYSHVRLLERKALKDKILKKKEEEKAKKLQEKQKAKDEKQNEKAAAKQKLKEEKDLKKTEKKVGKVSTDENLVIFSENGCKQILKTGARKGQICGCKIKSGDFCSRHTKKEEVPLVD
jgi:DNA-directed RNA polymerase subunit RPC12/RpoP